MARGLSLAVFVVAVCSSQAFMFGRDDVIARADGRAIDEECLALADQGDCDFYTCFEERLPCGRDWYILKQGQYYCLKINRIIETFPEQAQHFLRDSQKCLMQSLKDEYQQDSISCHTLEHNAIREISTCYNDNAFCTNLRGNYAQFFQIYETDDLISTGAGKVWREIAELGFQCGGEALSDITAIATSSLSGVLDNLVDSARGHGDTVAGAVDNLLDSARETLSNVFDFGKK